MMVWFKMITMRRDVKYGGVYIYMRTRRNMTCAHAHTTHTIIHTHTNTHAHTHTRRKITSDDMGKHVHACLCPTHTGPYKCTRPRDVKRGSPGPHELCMYTHTHIRTSTCVYAPYAHLGQHISSQNRCRDCDFRRCPNGQNCGAERPVMARNKRKRKHSTENPFKLSEVGAGTQQMRRDKERLDGLVKKDCDAS